MDVFGFGPMFQVLGFHSRLEDVATPTILSVGGFLRLRRPHGYEWNSSTGAAAVSPWVDADAQFVRTGPLNRFGAAVGIGAAFPLEESRVVWLGPFARWQIVTNEDGKVGFNTNDSHTLIFGASLEFDQPHAKPVKQAPVEPAKPEQTVPQPTPQPEQPQFQDVDIQLSQVVQFAWDSNKLDSVATQQLDSVIKKISEAKEVKSIKVEGHASSEGVVVHNDKLAQRRADSVMNYLADHGVSRDKLSAVGFGSRVPVADNKNESGRVQNRRAEFVVNFVIVQKVQK